MKLLETHRDSPVTRRGCSETLQPLLPQTLSSPLRLRPFLYDYSDGRRRPSSSSGPDQTILQGRRESCPSDFDIYFNPRRWFELFSLSRRGDQEGWTAQDGRRSRYFSAVSEGFGCRGLWEERTKRAVAPACLNLTEHSLSRAMIAHRCSGDMLLESLVACTGGGSLAHVVFAELGLLTPRLPLRPSIAVTLKAVATAMDITLKSGTVTAEGDLDFRWASNLSCPTPKSLS